MGKWRDKLFELMVERRMLVLSVVTVFILALCVAVSVASQKPKDSIYNYEDKTKRAEENSDEDITTEKEVFETMAVAEHEETKHFETLNEEELTEKNEENTTQISEIQQTEQIETSEQNMSETVAEEIESSSEQISLQVETTSNHKEQTSSTVQETPTSTTKTVAKPITKPATKPVTEDTTEQTQEQPTETTEETTTEVIECQHLNKKYDVNAATATTDGEWREICKDCDEILDCVTIHAHDIYTVQTIVGTESVYGYYSTSMTSDLLNKVNEYRIQQGINGFQNTYSAAAELRAIECAYQNTHIRPNGTDCLTVAGEGEVLLAENKYQGSFELQDVAEIVESWKANTQYGTNLLKTDVTKMGVSVFVKMEVDENGIMRETRVFAVLLMGQ